MSTHLQPLVPLVTLVKIEPPTVLKNESPEEALEEEISTDVKEDIDIVYHPLSEDLIKSETDLEDILDNKHLEAMQTQALMVKAGNCPFIKTENITQRNNSEDTSDGNVNKSSGQGVVEVQGSHEYSNTLSNLDTHEQLVLNSSKDLNDIGTTSRKAKHAIKTDFAQCYKTDGTSSWKEDKEKINVIKAPVIPVEAYEYTSLAKNKHVCNHCQHACNNLNNLKTHIRKMHREVTTMYQCPYCLYKSKWKQYIINQHIILKHKDTKYIQWFQCNLCEIKFKLKSKLTSHMKVHLKHKQMQDGLDLREKRYHCNNCEYKTDHHHILKSHNLVHLKPEEIEYFYCYHCSNKSKRKTDLKYHIFRQHFKNIKQGKRYGCNKCDYETYASTTLKLHKLNHLKPEDIPYFHCYYCSYKAKQKGALKRHIFTHHFKNVKQGKSSSDDDAIPTFSEAQINSLKTRRDSIFLLLPLLLQSQVEGGLKEHIFRHFKNGQVKFDCYICNFVTPKRESIIKHIKKHSKVQNKSEINERS